jgi:hypothetical protein
MPSHVLDRKLFRVTTRKFQRQNKSFGKVLVERRNQIKYLDSNGFYCFGQIGAILSAVYVDSVADYFHGWI